MLPALRKAQRWVQKRLTKKNEQTSWAFFFFSREAADACNGSNQTPLRDEESSKKVVRSFAPKEVCFMFRAVLKGALESMLEPSSGRRR